jgi:hypothetical protein
MNIRDIIKEEPKGAELFTNPASPSDKDNFIIQKPEDEIITKGSDIEVKKAQKKFYKSLELLQGSAKMLKDLGMSDEKLDKKINDLITYGLEAKFIRAL